MVYIGFLLEIPSYKLFHTFFSDFTPFLHTFFKFFFRSAHLLIHTNLLKKKVGQYLRRFSNFGWGHDFVTPTNDKRRTTPLRITIPWVDKVPQAKKWGIWAQNSIYFYYYNHIKVHLNGFNVQLLVETNGFDHIKPFIAVWLSHRL